MRGIRRYGPVDGQTYRSTVFFWVRVYYSEKKKKGVSYTKFSTNVFSTRVLEKKRNTLKSHYNGFQGIIYLYSLYPQSVGLNGTFVIVRSSITLGSVIARVYCSHDLRWDKEKRK